MVRRRRQRIYATTDKARGALKTLSDAEGYETFVVPDDIGGRYSVLTAVELLPMAAAGIDIDACMAGAKSAMDEYTKDDFASNDAMKYAARQKYLLLPRAKILRSWSTTNLPCSTSPNGGNSSTESLKAKTARAFFRHPSISPRISTAWASSFRTASAICSKQSSRLKTPNGPRH